MPQPFAAPWLTMRPWRIAGAVLLLLTGCQQLGKPTWSVSTAAASPVSPACSNADNAPPVNSIAAGALIVRGMALDEEPPSSSAGALFSTDDSAYRLGPQSGIESLRRAGFARGYATPVSASEEPSLFGIEERGGVAPLAPSIDAEGEPPQEAPSFAAADGTSLDTMEPTTISFREDLKQLPRMLWDDNLSLYNWQNAIVLGVAAGGAVAVRDNLDQRVRQETAEHPLRWGEGSVVLRQFGEYTVQVPALAGVYAVSVWTDNDKLHEFSKAVISAYSLSAMYTVAIKGITNTSRPTTQFENGHYGFPSYHASSTFSIAAVIDEYYGWEVALPAYVLGGLVGWSRIDQREHDLSDVLFGSVLGFVVGKTVAAAHLEQKSNFRITPYYDPSNRGSGVTVETKF